MLLFFSLRRPRGQHLKTGKQWSDEKLLPVSKNGCLISASTTAKILQFYRKGMNQLQALQKEHHHQ